MHIIQKDKRQRWVTIFVEWPLQLDKFGTQRSSINQCQIGQSMTEAGIGVAGVKFSPENLSQSSSVKQRQKNTVISPEIVFYYDGFIYNN